MENSNTNFNPEYLEGIAKVCHQANKAWCEKQGDFSQKNWDEAEDWQKESAIKGVAFRINNPNSGNDAQHNSWMQEKLDDGWVYGVEKNSENKTHPCIVSFEKLPVFQQKKDSLFCSIVDALTSSNIFDFTNDMSDVQRKNSEIKCDKQLRVNLDKELQKLKSLSGSRERSLSITKLQESIMWLGMDLKRLNEPNPYPDSYKPENSKIAPTADKLKM